MMLVTRYDIHYTLHNMIQAICATCKCQFSTYPSRLKRSENVFCSHKCYSKWKSIHQRGVERPSQQRRVVNKCLFCGKDRVAKLSEVKRGGGKFCDHRCEGLYYIGQKMLNWKNVDNSGKNNGRYKHGKRIGGRYSKEELRLREAVASRDQNRCVLCGEEWHHQHHITPKTMGGENTIDNLLCLCHKCHSIVHKDLVHWQPLLAAILQSAHETPKRPRQKKKRR
jgi:ribosomal protein S14